jgi:hypothetical protein
VLTRDRRIRLREGIARLAAKGLQTIADLRRTLILLARDCFAQLAREFVAKRRAIDQFRCVRGVSADMH